MNLWSFFSYVRDSSNCLLKTNLTPNLQGMKQIDFATTVRWRSCLRHCITSRKVAGSILEIIGIFRLHNSSGSPVCHALDCPLAEMNTRNISQGVKAVGV